MMAPQVHLLLALLAAAPGADRGPYLGQVRLALETAARARVAAAGGQAEWPSTLPVVAALQGDWTRGWKGAPAIPPALAGRLQAALLADWTERTEATGVELGAALDAVVIAATPPAEGLEPLARLTGAADAWRQALGSADGLPGAGEARASAAGRATAFVRAALDREIAEVEAARARAVEAEDYLAARLFLAYREGLRGALAGEAGASPVVERLAGLAASRPGEASLVERLDGAKVALLSAARVAPVRGDEVAGLEAARAALGERWLRLSGAVATELAAAHRRLLAGGLRATGERLLESLARSRPFVQALGGAYAWRLREGGWEALFAEVKVSLDRVTRERLGAALDPRVAGVRLLTEPRDGDWRRSSDDAPETCPTANEGGGELPCAMAIRMLTGDLRGAVDGAAAQPPLPAAGWQLEVYGVGRFVELGPELVFDGRGAAPTGPARAAAAFVLGHELGHALWDSWLDGQWSRAGLAETRDGYLDRLAKALGQAAPTPGTAAHQAVAREAFADAVGAAVLRDLKPLWHESVEAGLASGLPIEGGGQGAGEVAKARRAVLEQTLSAGRDGDRALAERWPARSPRKPEPARRPRG